MTSVSRSLALAGALLVGGGIGLDEVTPDNGPFVGTQLDDGFGGIIAIGCAVLVLALTVFLLEWLVQRAR
jgi:hypothetical protein